MPTSQQYEDHDAAESSRDSRPAAPNRNNSTWELVENPEGEHYYWNTDTGETSWTSPDHPEDTGRASSEGGDDGPEGVPLGAQAQPLTDTPPVMKFPSTSETGVSAALDPELLALGRIEGVPETIIRREAYLLTKKKHHGAGSKKPASSWAQYWAVLCVGFLFLFKDQSTKTSTKKPVHVIRLDSVRVEEVGKDTTKKKGAFRMELDQGAVWLIQPGKEGEMWEWMDAIREASREKSTSAEYENALSTLLPQGVPAVPDRKSNSQASKSVGNISTKNRSRRPTGGAKASGEVDDGSYEGKQAKQSVKTKIGAFLFKRPSVDKLKEQGIIKDEDVIFGGNLAAQVERGSGPIPAVVRLCVEQVDKRGLTSQGIYRLSGNASTIQKLKVQFNAQEKVDLGAEDLDINAVASTLKLYFRELDDPLIPFAFYDRFIAAAKLEDYNARLIELKNLVQAIPRPNYDTFEFIIRHLARVMSHSAENKMEPSNLAIVFGPTLIRPPEGDGTSGYTNILNMSYQNLLVEAVLVQVDWIFDGLDH
ncbi:Rho GTPase activation protein [Geranomyces variabilis]|nr:Rho GTPase activation protein [Geranomyces variabilis]